MHPDTDKLSEEMNVKEYCKRRQIIGKRMVLNRVVCVSVSKNMVRMLSTCFILYLTCTLKALTKRS